MSAIAYTCSAGLATPPSGSWFRPVFESFLELLEESEDRLPTSRRQLDLALTSLKEVFGDCSEVDWDGYNALPISYKAYCEAEKLLELLPPHLPIPEIVPEPTGEIGLEWYREKQYVFVISVGGNNIITYAGIFGEGNRTNGTEIFFESIPCNIINYILRLFPESV